MKTFLIGFSRSIGSFTSEKTGELIEYSNRDLRFITDSGANQDNIGFAQFTADKMKVGQLAQILKINNFDRMDKASQDNAVDEGLKKLINREVNVQFAPVGDKIKLVWFSAAEAETK